MNRAEKSLIHTVLEEQVIQALREIRDPELPVNIYDLGLIYDIDLDAAAGTAAIKMTLTAPGCPVAQSFPATVECAVCRVPGIREARDMPSDAVVSWPATGLGYPPVMAAPGE